MGDSLSRARKGSDMGLKNVCKLKFFLMVLVGLGFILIARTGFAAPPPPPPEPVPLFGEEFLIPSLVGYGIYRLRRKNK